MKCPECNPQRSDGKRDCAKLKDPNCTKCNKDGRVPDYSEDEWGMVMYLPCECTKRPDCPRCRGTMELPNDKETS